VTTPRCARWVPRVHGKGTQPGAGQHLSSRCTEQVAVTFVQTAGWWEQAQCRPSVRRCPLPLYSCRLVESVSACLPPWAAAGTGARGAGVSCPLECDFQSEWEGVRNRGDTLGHAVPFQEQELGRGLR